MDRLSRARAALSTGDSQTAIRFSLIVRLHAQRVRLIGRCETPGRLDEAVASRHDVWHGPGRARAPLDSKPRLEEAERRHILDVLTRVGWAIEGSGGAASMLGLQPSTLRSRLKKLGISRPRS
jgi:transcriptional regulator with GAF, ATPase, and Fis domain